MPRLRTHPDAALAAVCMLAAASADAPKIRLNPVGYLPDAEKKATIVAARMEFAVVPDQGGPPGVEGAVSGPVRNRDTEEDLYLADFSGVRKPGADQLEVPGVGRSSPFRVGKDVYRRPFVTVPRGMYFWRRGIAVQGTHDGQSFRHEACHTGDAWLGFVGGGHDRKDGTKGGYDAGDDNKYVANAAVTVGALFRAWGDFGSRIKTVWLDIPESGGTTPDFLAELRWEMEWLLAMQTPDGSAYHKVSTKDFGGFILPEREEAERHFTPWT